MVLRWACDQVERPAPRPPARSTSRGWLPAADPSSSPVGWPSSLMSSTGTTTERSHSLVDGGATTCDRAAAGEERGHLLDRPHRRRQADPLRRALEQLVEPVERDRQVGAALGAGHRVHLVDDHRLDAAQRLARGAGQQQEQRLGRGDEDVGGPPGEGAPLVGGGVAGADADADLGPRQAEPRGRLADPGQRRAQVALDVDRQRLERGDVEDAAARPARPAGGAAASRSSDHRKAASVLPEPVGATTRACSPLLIASQAPSWAAVGATKAPVNQARVGSENRSRAVTPSSVHGGTTVRRRAPSPGPGR